ncbi:DUF4270 family protein [Hymenobacter sp. GOD-10R]|uniref:DUF4270 family protein n=1 Tax=Hymenobacter sp. GOD-10R TaxID=3093922 RepID=UPI002D77E07C|nr:DUF4270 family protein [Hymenobacter sp. GOD-10R]WRQ29721.1 DUF4270 family protein [Hymenobacter sp. GOD-10R]
MQQNSKTLFRSLCAVGSLLLAALITSCSEPGAIGNDLPVTTDKVGITYIDTFTVRTSTVQLDSIASSTSSTLMVGRYVDPRLGIVEARGFTQVGLNNSATPSATTSYDSLVLTLRTDTYRYGDTTRTQHLLVQRLQENFVDKTYYTLDALRYDETPLGQVGLTQAKEYTFRARPGARTLRIRLTDDLGRELYQLARAGALTSPDDLQARFKGLVLSPGATDDAALLRYLISDASSSLNLYYHEAAASDPLVYTFPLTTGSRHFYRLRANRSATLLAPLTKPYQALSSSSTAAETYIQAGLGLYTRVDIPYINNLKELGGTLSVISAELTMEGVQGTESRYLAPPTTIALTLTDPSNRRGAIVTQLDGNAVTGVYNPLDSSTGSYPRISPTTGLEVVNYKFQLTTYLQAVLNRSIQNTGLLLYPTTTAGVLRGVVPDDVTRVVLGAKNNRTNPLQFRVYYARVQ